LGDHAPNGLKELKKRIRAHIS
jgi:hypothetical protein